MVAIDNVDGICHPKMKRKRRRRLCTDDECKEANKRREGNKGGIQIRKRRKFEKLAKLEKASQKGEEANPERREVPNGRQIGQLGL